MRLAKKIAAVVAVSLGVVAVVLAGSLLVAAPMAVARAWFTDTSPLWLRGPLGLAVAAVTVAVVAFVVEAVR